MSTAELSALVSRLEAVTSRLEQIQTTGGGAGPAEASSELVEEFDVVVSGKFKSYFDLSSKIGGEVAEHAKLVEQAFQLEREILVTACKHKAPRPDIASKVMKPLGAKVNEVIAFCEKRRGSKVFNHLMTVKEGIGCVGWVTVSPKPAPYVKEMYDQSLFYGNRVIKEFKGKDEQHVQWMRAFTGGIQDLQKYVKQFHTTGLVWNKEGAELSAVAAAPPSGPSPGGPPPPPPPAIQPPTDAPSSSKGGADVAAQRANLFASLNKGTEVTKGLRKVTDDMKTHKNPELRASSVVKASSKPAAKATPKATTTVVKKPPVCELQGKKWVVEYQDGNKELSISDASPKQAVYVFRCTNSTLRITGKVNGIILDNCKRMALCFDDVISSVEIINCQGAQVQVTGKCPTVSIDKTDGCQVFLSKDSMHAEIISAKSSEMNICIPKGDAGDFSEHALPEQFKTVWDGKQFVTECSEV